MLEKIKELFNSKSIKNENHEIYMNLMNTKQVYSLCSDKFVTFMDFSVEELIKKIGPDEGPFCNGFDLVDNAEEAYLEIKDMYVVLKDGSAMNLGDFSSEYGAYKEGDEFIENIKTLIADR